MIIALTYVGISLGTLLVLTVFYILEDRKGNRIFLTYFRNKLDAFLFLFVQKIKQWAAIFTTGFMRILFHYGAHSILKRLLATIRGLEARLEELVRKNRKVARGLGEKTRNHLDEIAEHKEEVALSDKEKEQMMSH